MMMMVMMMQGVRCLNWGGLHGRTGGQSCGCFYSGDG